MDKLLSWQIWFCRKNGARTVTMKSAGQEEVIASVCLADKSDGNKFKPFIIFKGAKCESKAPNDQYKSRCVIVSSSSRWMNTELTSRWMNTELTSRWMNTELTSRWMNTELTLEFIGNIELYWKNFLLVKYCLLVTLLNVTWKVE